MKIGNFEVYGIIYKIENLINGKVYIGQTMQSFNLRYCSKGKGVERVYKRHLMFRENGYLYNRHLLEAFEKYGLENFIVNECLDVAFSKYELNIKEQCWIQYYNSYKNGYNNTLGGEGVSGFEGLKKENNPTSRAVIQLSLDGKFIKEWSCMTYIEEQLGIPKSKVCCVCKEQRRSAGGFIWVYKEEYDENKDYSYKKYKPETKKVVQLDLNGNFIEIYDSCKDASEKLNLKRQSINKCCLHHNETYNGYIWMYEEEYVSGIKYIPTKKTKHIVRPIVVLNPNGEYIETIESQAEIIRKYGYSKKSLYNHLNKKPNKIKDYIFIFKEEYDKQIKNNTINTNND